MSEVPAYRVHIAVTDGIRRFPTEEDSDSLPNVGAKVWVNVDGFTGEVHIDSEYGHRETENGQIHVFFYAHPVR